MKRLYWATGFVWFGAMLGFAGCLAAMRYHNLWLILAGSLIGVLLGIVPAVVLLRGYAEVTEAAEDTNQSAPTIEPETIAKEPSAPIVATPPPVQSVPLKQFANRWEALELRGLETYP